MTYEEDMKEYVNELFYKLINEVPAMIDEDTLIYNVGGTLVKVYWFKKAEEDINRPVCKLIGYKPFDHIKKGPRFGLGTWSVMDRSRETIEGITFYIRTPAGTYTVPELSRSALCQVQDKIELNYKKFMFKYIKSLLDVQPSEYGKIVDADRYGSWIVKDSE